MERLDLRENTDGALNAVQAKINEIVDWITAHEPVGPLSCPRQQPLDAVSKHRIDPERYLTQEELES